MYFQREDYVMKTSGCAETAIIVLISIRTAMTLAFRWIFFEISDPGRMVTVRLNYDFAR